MTFSTYRAYGRSHLALTELAAPLEYYVLVLLLAQYIGRIGTFSIFLITVSSFRLILFLVSVVVPLLIVLDLWFGHMSITTQLLVLRETLPSSVDKTLHDQAHQAQS